MNYFQHFHDEVLKALEGLERAGQLRDGLDTRAVSVEPPRDPAHGDVATNAALVLAKPAGMKPRDIGELLAERLRDLDEVESAEVAGPGFVNLRLRQAFWPARLADVLRAGKDWGGADLGQGEKVNVEYVSANPTGPLTVGHARGAVVGDALARLLARMGYDVCKEYYVNDAGAQVDTLARSAYLRYREALGEKIGEIPSGYYPGEYLKDVGQALAERDGKRWLDALEEEWLPEVRSFAVARMMDRVCDDLDGLGIRHNVFTSERELVARGGVEEVLKVLEDRGLIYVGTLEPPKGKQPEDWEPRPQTLFRSSAFGDDTDRPIRKSDGSWTYFAADMANHLDKYRRGYRSMIDVWGADHGGYVKRMQAAVRALTDGEAELDVRLCQLVKLLRGGEPVKMSKRAGTFVTLREVVDEVGRGVVRFIMLTRKNDAPLDFDLERVLDQSRDNPVFYVQYAHARAHSVMRLARRELPDLDLEPAPLAGADLTRLTDSGEVDLMKLLAGWPRLLQGAAEAHEPHRVAFYLYDVAAAFHGLWTKGKDDASLRFLLPQEPELTAARLALVRGVQLVVASGLEVMGVEPVEEMR